MPDDRYRTRRLVLRESDPEGKVADFARAKGWRYVGEVPADPVEGVARELVWKVGSGSSPHYFDDIVSHQSSLVVSGEDEDEAERLVGEFEEGLNTWWLPELVAAVDGASDPVEKARAVVRAGLGAPHDFDSEIYRRIQEAIKDQDPGMREAGLWATTYEPWDEFYELLNEAVRAEQDERLQEHAFAIRQAFEIEKGMNPY